MLNFLKNIVNHKPKTEIEIIDPFSMLKTYDIDSIIDIGANEGQFVKKINKIFPETSLYCFEPLNEPFNKLNIDTKGLDKIKTFQYAIGNLDGELEINQNESSPSSSILEMETLHKQAFPFTQKSSKTKIKICKLDNIVEIKDKCKKPLIKIDTQGYELNVIDGGKNIIKRAPVIIIEVSYYNLYKSQPLFDDIYKSLINIGFSYIGNIEQLLDPRDLKPLQADAIFVNTKL